MERAEDQRPKAVEIAVYFLSATLIVGLLQITFGSNPALTTVDPVLLFFLLSGTYAFFGLLLYKIWHGKNWARITYSVFLAFGLLQTGIIFVFVPNAPHPVGALPFVMILIKVIAIGLLFSRPSNPWFKATAL